MNLATKTVHVLLPALVCSRSDVTGFCFPPTRWISAAFARETAAAAAESPETSGVEPQRWVSLPGFD